MVNKKPTIKDIAKIAKVSPTAVSMALNDRPRIGPETRKRILRIAKELRYQPNFVARSLVMKRSHTLGVIAYGLSEHAASKSRTFSVRLGLVRATSSMKRFCAASVTRSTLATPLLKSSAKSSNASPPTKRWSMMIGPWRTSYRNIT